MNNKASECSNIILLKNTLLNNLKSSNTTSGGELCIHSLKNATSDPVPQPTEIEAPIHEAIKPQMGSLIFFENTPTAYHSVNEMRGYSKERYFVYGSLTLLGSKNKKFRYSKHNLYTDIRMYL